MPHPNRKNAAVPMSQTFVQTGANPGTRYTATPHNERMNIHP